MIVGIDLGTTNCAVHYFDTELRHFKIPQYGYGALDLLPSFCYLDNEIIVGKWAKEEGSKIPTRLVHSAKSWLSNPGADRCEKILPLEADAYRISPVEATAAYLRHIREMWNREHEDLEDQEVVLTIPASFDEVARSLTLKAAQMAGLSPTLLEEPQAAFYAWMGKKALPIGSTILVCDIGGGTSDFSLIDVVESGFRRMAVGRHLLLGGDNIDYALAHRLGCDNVHAVREAKEKLLSSDVDQMTFWVEGKGSSIMSGKSYTLTRDLLDIDGFFGLYDFDEAREIQVGSGIKRVGLPFESEPSFTKQLAHFLWKSQGKPDYVLFNGGTLKPKLFQQRIVQSLERWFGAITLLESDDLDLAVSKGAVIFKMHQTKRIQGGSARGYYLGIDVKNAAGETEKKALTLISRGSEEGTWFTPDQLFTLRSNQPISFELYSSHIRLHDQPGTIVAIDLEEMALLPPIYTLLKLGKQKSADVHLKAHYSAIGTLELFLAAERTNHTWKLDFEVRKSDFAKPRIEDTFEEGGLDRAKAILLESFSPGQSEALKGIVKKLEQELHQPKNAWTPTLLRALFDVVIQQASKRHLSSFYEARFWNLAGFFLRPGNGYPLDDHRVKELWKLHIADKNRHEEVQKWICMRRIAAGLSKGQQVQLFNVLFPTIWKIYPNRLKNWNLDDAKAPGLNDRKRVNINNIDPLAIAQSRELSRSSKSNSSGGLGIDSKKEYLFSEKLRCLASLELVNHDQKIKLGKGILQRLEKGKAKPFDYWSLGRLGARRPLYGSIANTLPKRACEEWLKKLLALPFSDQEHLKFTLLHLARKTDSREVNVSEEMMREIEKRYAVQLDVLLSEEEREHFYGDSLPPALYTQTVIK